MEVELTNLANNCEESIGKILDSIRKEATLKVEARQALCIVFVPPEVGIPRVLLDEQLIDQTNQPVYQSSITHPK